MSCNTIDALTHFLSVTPEPQAWVFVTYTSRGFLHELKRSLSASPHTLIWEEDMELNPWHDGDNYFTVMVSRHVMSVGSFLYDGRYCSMHGTLNQPVGKTRN